MKSRFYVLMSILVVLSLILSSTLVVFAAENNLDEKSPLCITSQTAHNHQLPFDSVDV